MESLSLINVGLTSLKGFPKLPNLRKLELSDNRISNGLNLLHGSTKLTHLNLSGNKVKDIESLEPLKEFTSLQNLDLFNNDVTSVENYREKLFNLVPGLKFLDGFDREDREAEDSDDGEDEEDGNDVGDGESEGDGKFSGHKLLTPVILTNQIIFAQMETSAMTSTTKMISMMRTMRKMMTFR